MQRAGPGEPIGRERFHDALGNYDIQVMDLTLSQAGMQELPDTTSVLGNWCGNEPLLYDSILASTTRAVVVHRVIRGVRQGRQRDISAHFLCLRFHAPSNL